MLHDRYAIPRRRFGQLGMETTEEEIRAAAQQLRGREAERQRKTQWTKGVIRALIVVCVFFIFQQITGINIPFYYGPKILATFFQSGTMPSRLRSPGSRSPPFWVPSMVIATYFAFRWIDKVGRRPLAIEGTRDGGLHGDRGFRGRVPHDIPKTVVVMVGFSFFITSFAIGVGGTGLADQGEGVPYICPRPGGRDRRCRGLGRQFRAYRSVPGLAECLGTCLAHDFLRCPLGSGDRIRVQVPSETKGLSVEQAGSGLREKRPKPARHLPSVA